MSCRFELSPSPGQHLQQAPRKHFPYRYLHVPSHCWDSLNSDLSHCDWSFLRPGNSPTVDDAVDRFSIVLEQTFQHHLADFSTHSCRSNTRTSSVTSNPPWLSTVLVSAVKRKRDLFSVSRKFPTPVNMEAYRVQRNFVKYLSRKTYRSYISSLSATISSPNRPSLYQFIRTQRPSVSRAPIQCLIDPDGNRQSEAKSIADTLNKQFVSPGLPDDPNWVIPPLHPAPELRAPLLEVFTTTGVVRKQLKRLKSCKSPGKGGIPNEVLKLLVPSLSYPLCLLFNLSYRAGVFPSAWKSATVVPIFNPRTATTFSTPRTAKRCHLTPAYISMSKTYDIVYYSFCFQCWLSLAAFMMYTTLWDSPRHYCWLCATKIQCTRIGNCEG